MSQEMRPRQAKVREALLQIIPSRHHLGNPLWIDQVALYLESEIERADTATAQIRDDAASMRGQVNMRTTQLREVFIALGGRLPPIGRVIDIGEESLKLARAVKTPTRKSAFN